MDPLTLAHGNIYLFKLLFCLAMVGCFLLAAVLGFLRSKHLRGLSLVATGLLFLACGWGFDAVAYSPLYSPETPYEGSIPHIAGAWGCASLGGGLVLLGLFLARPRPAASRR